MNMNISLTEAVSSSSSKPPEGDALSDITDPRNDNYTVSREELIESLCKVVGRDDGGKRRPLRILIFGKHGAGKSSFINSIAAALSGEWHEYSYAGLPGAAQTVTVHVLRYPKCCLENDRGYSRVLLPTLIDVPGLTEDVDDSVELLLRLLLFGHIEEDKACGAVYEELKNLDQRAVRKKYSQVYEHMKIDRLVFVASAEEKIPKKLLQCALEVARPEHDRENTRSVPIFGVLTKADKVNTTTTSFKDMQKKFMECLGINAKRYLLCKNYCDDTDNDRRDRGSNDDIDLPILEFMKMLCDPALKVIKPDESLKFPVAAQTKGKQVKSQTEGGEQTQIPQVLQMMWASFNNLQFSLSNLILSLTAGVVVWFALQYMLKSMVEGRAAMVESICQTKNPNDPDMQAICALPAASFPFLIVTLMSLLFASLVYVIGNKT